MEYRTLGEMGLSVSVIGFGAWGIGGYNEITGTGYGPTNDNNSLAALERAWDLGCNFVDTADSYGVGHSEEVLGKFMKGRRDKVILATKFGHWPEFDDKGNRIYLPPTPEHVRRYLEASLTRLQTDYIDLYQWHSADLDKALANDLAGTMESLIKDGKIRHAGISVYGSKNIRQIANGEFGEVFSTLQESVNATTFPRFKGSLTEAQNARIGIIAREPLANGMLTGKGPTLREDGRMAREMRDPHQAMIRAEFAERLKSLLPTEDRSLVQGLIRFVIQSGVSTVIPGCRTIAQVEENFGACEVPRLTDEDIAAINKIYDDLTTMHGSIHPYAMASRLGMD